MTDQVAQRTLIAVCLDDDVPAVSAIATIRASPRHEGFATKTAAAIAAVTCPTVKNHSISKHYRVVLQTLTATSSEIPRKRRA
jgi:hypothetical protein